MQILNRNICILIWKFKSKAIPTNELVSLLPRAPATRNSSTLCSPSHCLLHFISSEPPTFGVEEAANLGEITVALYDVIEHRGFH